MCPAPQGGVWLSREVPIADHPSGHRDVISHSPLMEMELDRRKGVMAEKKQQ